MEMRDTVGAGALGLVEQTIAEGAAPQAARKWWLCELARRSNEDGVDIVDPPHHPRPGRPHPGAGRREGRSTTSSPARSSRACSPERAPPTRSWRKRGLAVVSDDGALGAAVDKRHRGQPRRRRQDPRRQARRRRSAHRRGDEGDARPGRRGPGARADPGEALLTLRAPDARPRSRWCRAALSRLGGFCASARGYLGTRRHTRTTLITPVVGEAGRSPALTRNRRPPPGAASRSTRRPRHDHDAVEERSGSAHRRCDRPLQQRKGST